MSEALLSFSLPSSSFSLSAFSDYVFYHNQDDSLRLNEILQNNARAISSNIITIYFEYIFSSTDLMQLTMYGYDNIVWKILPYVGILI